MTKLITKKFELDLDNNKKLLETLEEIAKEHKGNAPEIFHRPVDRMSFKQQPYYIKDIFLELEEGKINFKDLKKIIKLYLEPCVIIYKNSEWITSNTFFLPEAVDKNPLERKLIYETEIGKRLKFYSK